MRLPAGADIYSWFRLVVRHLLGSVELTPGVSHHTCERARARHATPNPPSPSQPPPPHPPSHPPQREADAAAAEDPFTPPGTADHHPSAAAAPAAAVENVHSGERRERTGHEEILVPTVPAFYRTLSEAFAGGDEAALGAALGAFGLGDLIQLKRLSRAWCRPEWCCAPIQFLPKL